MLISIVPVPGITRRTEFMPELLRPLVSAVKSGIEVTAVVLDIVRRLGFDNMMHGASTSARLDHESRSYVFTTFPQRWVARYDQQAYIECDTRITRALDSALPLIWDHVTKREGAIGSAAMAYKLGISERTVQFHFDGIRSKLGAANRQEAIAKAIAAGIIQP